jgi:hypothetical protein
MPWLARVVVCLALVAGTSRVDPVPWSATRRLAWSDFLGPPQLRTGASATTVYELSYDGDCDSGAFRFRVLSVFLPERSWVRPDLPFKAAIGRLALQHEQTHFDLSEVHARKMRRALSELADPCSMTAEARQAIVASLAEDDRKAQHRYDDETSGGPDLRRQALWDENVSKELARLNRYADTPPRGPTR